MPYSNYYEALSEKVVCVMPTFNILHLEDDHSIRTSMRSIFDIMLPQANVAQFSNSDDAVAYVTQSSRPEVHLFLLDVRVPGKVDGIGFALRARELGYAGAIAFVSAYTKPDPGALPKSLNYTWLSKPIDLDALLKITEHLQLQV